MMQRQGLTANEKEAKTGIHAKGNADDLADKHGKDGRKWDHPVTGNNASTSTWYLIKLRGGSLY